MPLLKPIDDYPYRKMTKQCCVIISAIFFCHGVVFDIITHKNDILMVRILGINNEQ